MNTSKNVKITVFCPSGHRLRGGTELMGKTVRCPRCECEFIFAPTIPERTSDDYPSRTPVSESRVMAILGELDQAPAKPNPKPLPSQPCPKCSAAVIESLTVCPTCNTYIGLLPKFLRRLQIPDDSGQG